MLQLVSIDCVALFVGGAAPAPGAMGVIETEKWLALSWLRKKHYV